MRIEPTLTSIEMPEVVLAAVIILASISVITWLIFGIEKISGTRSKVEI